MKKMRLLLLVFFVVSFVFTSCNEDDTFDPNAKGELMLSFTKTEISSKLDAKINDIEPTELLISLENQAGEVIYKNEKIELFKFNDSYISTVISLKVGDYRLTEFMVVDANNNIVYVTPKEGSDKAYLVDNPLSIEYSILEDEVIKISPEVLSVENISPEEFGYNTFSFNIVESFNFLTAVFKYNESTQNFELTAANILIESNNDTLYNNNLDAITNLITLNADYDNYSITISKSGYLNYNYTFTKDSLIKHFSTPLTVILEEGNKIVLQPGAEGIDAIIWSCTPDDPNPNTTNFQAMAWTWDALGFPSGVRRSLVKFDLSSIPSGAIIEKAELSLFSHTNSPDGFHSSLSGSNEGVLERITSNWVENEVTWNNQPSCTSENSVVLDQSTIETQDYIDMDVTEMVKLMNADQLSNYGMMIKLKTEDYYRRLIFASSDHEDESIRPKLVIYYSE
jgi:hypothetical protein